VMMVTAAFFLPLQTAHPQMVQQAVIVGSLILICNSLKGSLLSIFQTRLQLHKQTLVNVTTSLLILFFSLALIHFQKGLVPLVGAVILANLIGIAVGLVLAQKTIGFDFRPDGRFIKRLLVESFPMGAILLIFTIDNKIDTVMLGSIKGSGAVGVYAVAYRIYDVLILGAAYLMFALLPIISRYSDIKKWGGKLRLIYRKSFDVLFLMALVVMIGTWLLAPLAVRVMTQSRFNEFQEAVVVLRILGLALFLAYLNHLTGYTIVALGRQRRYFFLALSAVIFNVVANLLVIPRYSFYGAAVVTVLTESLMLLITTVYIFRLLKIIPTPFKSPQTIVDFIRNRGKIF